jgi:hypothetical protein
MGAHRIAMTMIVALLALGAQDQEVTSSTFRNPLNSGADPTLVYYGNS